MDEDIVIDSEFSPEEMSTPSKRQKLTHEILTEQSKEKEINDLKNQLEKQKVENQELLDGISDLKNQLAYQKEKLCEKDEALKINKENIVELKSQRDKIQEKYDLLKHPLNHVADEVQLNIFKFLEIEDLIRCAQVSKRTRRICHDESLWEKVNLGSKLVPSEFIEQILENGCKYINLSNAKIVGGLKLSRNDYNVKYLNLFRCIAEEGVLEKLISSCQSLQKLSLSNLDHNNRTGFKLKSLNHKQLETLDLNEFKGLDLELMMCILSCKSLTEISFFNNWHISNDCLQYLVENLPSGIEKLSFSGLHELTDEHIKTLVQRCKKIAELELSGCPSITEDSLTSIVEHAKQMVKLDFSHRNIGLLSVQKIFSKVRSMPKLKVLHCEHSKRSSEETENLRKLMPHLEINKEHYGGHLNIANPKRAEGNSRNDFWDISVNPIDLFPNTFDYGRQGRKSKWGDKMKKIFGMMS